MPSYVNFFVFYLVADVKNCISMELERCFLMVPLSMPAVVALSQYMGVGGCRLLSYDKVSKIVCPSLTFMNSAPNSASATDNAKNLRMVQRIKIAPLSVMGSPSLGIRDGCTNFGAIGRKVIHVQMND